MSGPQIAVSGAVVGIVDADIERGYMNGAGHDTSSGSTDGVAASLEAQLGYRLLTNAGLRLTPYANIRTSVVNLDGYTESGGSFPAEIDGFDIQRTTLRLGAEARHAVSDSTELFASAAWGHLLCRDDSDISGELLGLFPFSVPNSGTYEDFAELAFGASWTGGGKRVSTSIGTTLPTDGGDASGFGRLTISN